MSLVSDVLSLGCYWQGLLKKMSKKQLEILVVELQRGQGWQKAGLSLQTRVPFQGASPA